MKKLTLIIAIALSGMLMQAQTLKQVSFQLLGQESRSNENYRQSTDYGSFVFKTKAKKGLVTRITVTITNDNPMYDSIMNNLDYHEFKVGSMWTDFIFNFEQVVTGEYDNIDDAVRHLEYYMNTGFDSHKNTKIYKHPKKEKYVVSMLIYKRYQYGFRLCTSDTGKYIVTKKWKTVDI